MWTGIHETKFKPERGGLGQIDQCASLERLWLRLCLCVEKCGNRWLCFSSAGRFAGSAGRFAFGPDPARAAFWTDRGRMMRGFLAGAVRLPWGELWEREQLKNIHAQAKERF